MIWNYVLVGLGQLLVALVFGEVVSQYPIAGGLYPWAMRLVGRRWAWMAGWIYAWALFVTVAAVAVGGAPYISQLLGVELSPAACTVIAVAMIAVSTALNVRGSKLLARVAMFGFVCELVGAIAVGGYLLLFARRHDLSILFDGFHLGGGSYLGAFLASSVAAMFCYYGFEACGDVAEETPNAGVAIPRAMRMTIYVGGGAAMFVCLALLLSVPDIPAVLAGRDKDPVGTTLRAALGDLGFRAVIAVVLVSFGSCLLSLQAAASRLLFAYARDGMLFANQRLARMSPRTRVPVNALVVTGVLPAAIAAAGYWLEDAVGTIIAGAAIGIYIAFQMIVVGALVARARGWRPGGRFTLGRWGLPVNVAALLYGSAAVLNMLWPRAPEAPWYTNYAMLLFALGVVGSGLVYLVLGRPHARLEAASVAPSVAASAADAL
jgi:amino acid transporter